MSFRPMGVGEHGLGHIGEQRLPRAYRAPEELSVLGNHCLDGAKVALEDQQPQPQHDVAPAAEAPDLTAVVAPEAV